MKPHQPEVATGTEEMETTEMEATEMEATEMEAGDARNLLLLLKSLNMNVNRDPKVIEPLIPYSVTSKWSSLNDVT